MACLADKQTQRKKKISVVKQFPMCGTSNIGNLETECKEIIETVPEDAQADD